MRCWCGEGCPGGGNLVELTDSPQEIRHNVSSAARPLWQDRGLQLRFWVTVNWCLLLSNAACYHKVELRRAWLQTLEARQRALADLLPYQRADFEGLLRAMDGLPVTIRLLDPPLHEFLPEGDMHEVQHAKQGS